MVFAHKLGMKVTGSTKNIKDNKEKGKGAGL